MLLFQINGEDVSSASHEHVVSLIRRSGDLVQMTVVSPSSSTISTVPNSKSSMTFSCSGSNGTTTAPSTPPTRQYATLPRKLSNNSTLGEGTKAHQFLLSWVFNMNCISWCALHGLSRCSPFMRFLDFRSLSSSSASTKRSSNNFECRPGQGSLYGCWIGYVMLISVFRWAKGLHWYILIYRGLLAKNTLSCNSHSKMLLTVLIAEGGGEREEGLESSTGRSSSAESIHCPSGTNSNTGSIAGGLNTGTQPRTASIRARPTSSRITATELEELFQRQQGSGGSALMSSYFQASRIFLKWVASWGRMVWHVLDLLLYVHSGVYRKTFHVSVHVMSFFCGMSCAMTIFESEE